MKDSCVGNTMRTERSAIESLCVLARVYGGNLPGTNMACSSSRTCSLDFPRLCSANNSALLFTALPPAFIKLVIGIYLPLDKGVHSSIVMCFNPDHFCAFMIFNGVTDTLA